MLRNQNPIFDRLKVVALPDTGNYESSSKFQESVIQRKKNHLKTLLLKIRAKRT